MVKAAHAILAVCLLVYVIVLIIGPPKVYQKIGTFGFIVLANLVAWPMLFALFSLFGKSGKKESASVKETSVKNQRKRSE